MKNELAIFEGYPIRRFYDENTETWWFSVVDIVRVLTQSDYQVARKYWKVLKGRLAKEGSQLVTNCYQLKMVADDGKQRVTKFTNEVLEKLCKALNVSKDQILKPPPQLSRDDSASYVVKSDLTAEQIRITHLEKMLIDLASHLPGTVGEVRTAYILSPQSTLSELTSGKEPK
jgi:hypothetical protein